MTDRVTFDIEGFDAVLDKMRNVSQDTADKGTAFALRKASELVRDAARGRYILSRLDDPDTEENIVENIVVRKGSRRSTLPGDIKYRVGVLGGARSPKRRNRRRGKNTLDELGEIAGKGAGNPGGDTFYWRFLEFGTRNIRARPFMRPALSENTGKATSRFVREYNKALDRAIKRSKKK